MPVVTHLSVFGANLYVRDPLGVNGKGMIQVACAIHTTNVIFQQQYYVARCLISCVGNIFGLRSACVLSDSPFSSVEVKNE
jgi:hypothetical protein